MLSIRKSSVAYILEADREQPKDMQTLFFIKQKTLEDENTAATYYQDAALKNRGGKKGGWSASKLSTADLRSFVLCVTRIENYFLAFDAPAVATYDAVAHFTKKMQDENSGIVEVDIKGVKYFNIPIVDDEKEIKYIASTLDGASRTEILEATEDISKMSDVEKK